jgi:hypothetical protein
MEVRQRKRGIMKDLFIPKYSSQCPQVKYLIGIFKHSLGEEGSKFPNEVHKGLEPEKMKYCRFHCCHEHTIKECIKLRDPIEDLI